MPTRSYPYYLASAPQSPNSALDVHDKYSGEVAARVALADAKAIDAAIAAAVAGKARIVEQDECETSGRRALLNLGHTFGHALEAETGYSDRLLHGEAVALG